MVSIQHYSAWVHETDMQFILEDESRREYRQKSSKMDCNNNTNTN